MTALLILLAALAIYALARRIGPKICVEGYQDETGFHLGEQTKP